MKAPSPLAVRTFVLTAAVTTITIGGTLFGAELKSKQEARQVRNHPNPSLESLSLTWGGKRPGRRET